VLKYDERAHSTRLMMVQIWLVNVIEKGRHGSIAANDPKAIPGSKIPPEHEEMGV
jgi:hypothetical protein